MTEAKEVLTARVAVPQSKDDPSIVTFEEIPLPPRELWEELTNDDPALPEAKDLTASEATSSPEADEMPAVATLEFVNSTHQQKVPLKHPFRWKGQVVDFITVKRLTLGQVDIFVRRAAKTSFSTFDIYAEMTGLPADVLRGLVDEDGDAVVDVAYDFLPRPLKAETASTAT